jgi:hypothetical protein
MIDAITCHVRRLVPNRPGLNVEISSGDAGEGRPSWGLQDWCSRTHAIVDLAPLAPVDGLTGSG